MNAEYPYGEYMLNLLALQQLHSLKSMIIFSTVLITGALLKVLLSKSSEAAGVRTVVCIV